VELTSSVQTFDDSVLANILHSEQKSKIQRIISIF
jgi:hypothetical protein